MRKGLIWHIIVFIIACFFCLSTNKAFAQLSQNPDKFLGNITTRYSVDAGGGVPAYYTLWNQITPENESKWGSVEGIRGSYNWGSDTPFNYAKNHNFTYKFKALVWGAQYPNWFNSSLSVNERYNAIVNWFDQVKAHYPDLPLIDVVNEAVGMHQQGNLLMKESLGGGGKTGYDWLIKAFELAHERWPNAILIYNDFNTFQWDTDAYIDLVRTLRDAGAPIDAYGCQSHDVDHISKSNLQTAMTKIQNAVKLPMYITELDVNIEDDNQQKTQYQSIFPLIWEADYCAGVTIWGYVYGATWVDYSGLYKNGVERPAMTWLKEYMATDKAKNAKSPFPGGKKQISLYIKPASLKATRGETLDITVRAEMVDKTKSIDSIKFYVNDALYTIMTEAPYIVKYVPASNGKYTLKAVVYTSDGKTYEREGSFTAYNPRSPYQSMSIPGTIQAENFDIGGDGITYHDSNSDKEGDASSYRSDCEGVDIVNGNGGMAIGYTNTEEWLEYTINVQEAGYYTYEVIASSGTTGSGFKLSLSDNEGLTDLTDNISVPQTAYNEWDTYKSIIGRTTIPLKEGKQIIRLTITGASCNIDKITMTHVEIDGTINLKITTTPLNCTVGTNDTLRFTPLNDENESAITKIKLFLDGTLLSDKIINRPFQYVYKPLTAGSKTFSAIAVDNQNRESDIAKYTLNVRGPYNSVINIPGTIQAENFDIGGEGFTFHDSDLIDNGNTDYRTDNKGVDIFNDNEHYYIGYTNNGEWLEYTVNIKKSGKYRYTAYVNSITAGSSFRIGYMNGNVESQIVTVSVPQSNSSSDFSSISGICVLPHGTQTLRFTITGANCFIDKVEFSFKDEHYQFSVDDITYYTETDSTVSIIRCEKDGNIVIPSTVFYDEEEFKVVEIKSNIFNSPESIKCISVPENVKIIANNAFSGCSNIDTIYWNTNISPSSVTQYCKTSLKYVLLGDNITHIGTSAFSGCNKLTNIIIPENVTIIDANSFSGCYKLTSITIPKSVSYISNDAFYDCSGLTSIFVDPRNTVFDSRNNCNAIIESSTGNLILGCVNTIIPESVTSIGNYAFAQCTGITSLTIPQSVTNIAYNAFLGCNNIDSLYWNTNISPSCVTKYCNNSLKYVLLGDSITNIGTSAFSDCNKLTNITIPENVNVIDANAFYNCTALKSITIPENVTSINYYAFAQCTGITSLTIPQSVTNISNYAFLECNNIDSLYWNTNISPSYVTQYCQTNLKHVFLGDSITAIGSNAFANCTAITSITIPENVSIIDDNAFLNCTNIPYITIPNKVISIGSNAFSGCLGLTSVTIPNNVTTIGDRAFADCKQLVSISISKNVLEIDNEAFYGCTGIENLLWDNQLSPMLITQYCSNNLKTIELGEDFQSLDENVLQDCNLNTLVIGAGVKTINEQHFKAKPNKTIWLTNTPPDGYSNVEGVINYVANNNYDLLQKKIVYPFLSSMFNVNGVRYVPVSPSERTCDAIDCLYDKCYTNVVIDSTVSYKNVSMTVHKVNSYSFYRNDNITNAALKINEGLGASVFEGCTNLLGILLDGAVNYIDSAAFKGCSSLKNIKIPDSTETIGVSAFQNCTELSQIDLGIKLKSIGSYAFANCSSLNSIVIPQSVANISDYVFVGCTGIKTIVIDEAEDSIADVELILGSNGTSALFADCPLDSVFIGKNIVYPTNRDKGYSPFYSNSTLRTVVITNRETEISQNEFYGCSNLKKVSIGNGVTTIGSWAFSGCFSLDSFAFGTNVKSIGDEAFSDCNKMTKIISYASIPPTCGSQALDDINKWNCTLYIPEGSLADYQVADQWREFFFIEDDLENGIPSIFKKNDSIDNFFDLKGNKLNMPNTGINIIRYDDGSTKKVMIK